MERSMKRTAAFAAAALALITGGGMLAGCGSDSASSGADAASTATASTTAAPNGVVDLPAQEILDKSTAAANAASSVTVSGSITEGPEKISIDMKVGKDSADGTIQVQGVTVQIRAVGGKSYLKLSGEDFAKIAGQGDSPEVAKAISALIGDKWLVVPANSGSQLDGFNQLAQKDSLIKGVLDPDGNVTVKGPGNVNGIPVALLEVDSSDGTLAIQTVGEPYPVQIKGDGDEGSGQIDFSDGNIPFEVTAPTDVVNIEALLKLGDSAGTSTSN